MTTEEEVKRKSFVFVMIRHNGRHCTREKGAQQPHHRQQRQQNKREESNEIEKEKEIHRKGGNSPTELKPLFLSSVSVSHPPFCPGASAGNEPRTMLHFN